VKLVFTMCVGRAYTKRLLELAAELMQRLTMGDRCVLMSPFSFSLSSTLFMIMTMARIRRLHGLGRLWLYTHLIDIY
jgi:hypothetical protein